MGTFLKRTADPQVADLSEWLQTCQYVQITSLDHLDEWLAPVRAAKTPLGADLETTTLNLRTDHGPRVRVVGVSLARAHGDACYIPVGHAMDYEQNLPWPAVLERLRALDAEGVTTLWYNARYDHEVLWICSDFMWEEPTHFEEVRWAVWLFDASQRTFDLKSASKRILKLQQPTYKSVVGAAGHDDDEEERTFDQVTPSAAVMYACADADCTRRLWFHPQVQARLKPQRGVYTLERSLLLPFRRCMRNGQYWDDKALEAAEIDLGGEVKSKVKSKTVITRPSSGRIGALDAALAEANGGPLNFDAPAQIGVFLTEKLGVKIEERTDGDQVATGEEVLAKYKSKHPLVAAVILRRQLAAYDRNYIRKIRAALRYFGTKLHFPFNQIGAPTGRMSSGGDGKRPEVAFRKGVVPVNEQSLPAYDSDGELPDIRGALVANDPTQPIPEDPWEIWAVDFSQIELRVAANLSREPAWVEAFLSGADIHHRNAELAYGVKFARYGEDGHEDPRRKKGKTMGFAVLFGATAATVAEHGGISEAQAQQLLDRFYANAPVLTEWIARQQAQAAMDQQVSTWLGRARPLNEFYREGAPRSLRSKGDREAVNSPIQGGAADLFKIAICRADKLIHDLGIADRCEMLLFLHDEIVFRARRSLRDTVLPLLLEKLTLTIPGHPVPYTCEAEVGPNWGAGFQRWEPPVASEATPQAVTVRRAARPDPPPLPPAPRMRFTPEAQP